MALKEYIVEEIKEGDIVQLKSGSVDMTVSSVSDYMGTTSAWLVWEDAKGVHQEKTYAVAALKKVG